MRYPRILSSDQIKYLLENGHLPNKELAEKFNTTKEIVATYKSRARKAGIDIPIQEQKNRSIGAEMVKIAQDINLSSENKPQ